MESQKTESFQLIQESKLEKFQSELTAIRKQMEQSMSDQFKFTWIESHKVPPLLGISNRTWQTYRDKKLIPFSQFGAKIYVRLSDIDKFLEKHLIQK